MLLFGPHRKVRFAVGKRAELGCKQKGHGGHIEKMIAAYGVKRVFHIELNQNTFRKIVVLISRNIVTNGVDGSFTSIANT